MRTTSRMPCVDALKAIACLLIVLHHLAFYGPMSDAAYALAPSVIDFLYQYGRMAVQAFFVIAGFLMAAKFAPHGKALPTQPVHAIYQRYLRLAIPYLAALICAIVFAALVREWLTHDSIPGAPSLMQFLSHVFFLQDLVGQEALSAGVWYVAIDLQLFSMAALLMWGAGRIEARYTKLHFVGPIAIALVTATSLFFFNLHTELDATAFYFFGSYGLGALAYWAARRQDGVWWLALLATAVMATLLFDFRSRILVAGGVMLLLGIARQTGAMEALPVPRFLVYLGRISYSVFLIHFPLCMVVNAFFFHFFPEQPIANLIGMVVALVVSIAGGALLFKWVENRPLPKRRRLLASTGALASGMLATQQANEIQALQPALRSRD